MAGKLKDYFPAIRERDEVLQEICSRPDLDRRFRGWTTQQQDEFLDLCTGAKGIKPLYDVFFKEVMSPEYHPERLSRLLSLLLGTDVQIRTVLQNESPRLADEQSLLVMDIVVRLGDGSIANVEVQKVGYAFPGQRSACYSADLLLRQYRRIRKAQKRKSRKKFSYRKLQNVYTIVLYERSLPEFRAFPDTYLHWFEQRSDTGLKLELLQKYLFVPLDIFGKWIQNKSIKNETEAWLAFLSQDDPETVARLVEDYPDFRDMYDEIYGICRNVEDVMGIFSEELRIMDRNTVDYMIEELKEKVASQEAELDSKNTVIANQQAELSSKNAEIANQQAELSSKNAEIANQQAELSSKNAEIASQQAELSSKNAEIANQQAELSSKNAELDSKEIQLQQLQEQVTRLEKMLRDRPV